MTTPAPAPDGRTLEARALSPVSLDPDPEQRAESGDGPRDGTGLCLSGGGYRAMLFHVGALWRLNELGRLGTLNRISAVSGGSITAAVLGLGWSRLEFVDGIATAFEDVVVAPLRRMGGRTIDVGAVLGGLLGRGSVADRVVKALRRDLFGEATLQDLPSDVVIVLNATNLQTGTLWRFSRADMGDYNVGWVTNPDVPLAVAVAASSAFPPVLCPLRLSVPEDRYSTCRRGKQFKSPFTTEVVLADGGVYDNLGLQGAWRYVRTVLVSDGGGHLAPQGRIAPDWARQAKRIVGVVDQQVRDLRLQQVVAGFARGDRDGAYWGVRSDVADFRPLPPGALPAPHEATGILAGIDTRLAELDPLRQEQLINWGYAVTDVSLRRWLLPDAPAPTGFPYPAAGVGAA